MDDNSNENEPHLAYEAADKIIKKLDPQMVDVIFSVDEVMRTADIVSILSYLGWKDIMRA